MSKKHKIAKKEAQAQKKLYEEEVLVENLENEKVKEVESGVIQTSDDSVSSSEENNEIVEDYNKAIKKIDKSSFSGGVPNAKVERIIRKMETIATFLILFILTFQNTW